jgi:hypothetical protein
MICSLIKHRDNSALSLQEISCRSGCHGYVIWINSNYTVCTENIRNFRLQQKLIKD